MSINDKSILFVSYKDDKFFVNPNALNIIDSIKCKIAVVAVTGPKLGKSSLLNWIVEKPNCFSVDSSISKDCAEIYLWTSGVTHNNCDEYQILYLDTVKISNVENINEINRSLQLFSLSVLVSSVIIHNSRFIIDNQSVHELAFITELSKYIRTSLDPNETTEIDMSNFSKHFPTFLWAIRDFDYEKVEPSQKDLSADLMMEKILMTTKGFDRATFERNRIRNMITSFFTQRRCIYLPKPLQDDNALEELGGSMSVESLSEGFQTELSTLKDYLRKDVQVKAFHGCPLTGPMLARLVTSFVNMLNSDTGILNLSLAWKEVCLLESRSAIDSAMTVYQTIMEKELCPPQFVLPSPREENDIRAIHEVGRVAAISHFRSKCFHDDQITNETTQMFDILLEKLSQQLYVYIDMNHKISMEGAERLLLELYQSYIKNKIPSPSPTSDTTTTSIQSNIYCNDILQLRNDWREMTFTYHQSAKGLGKYIILSEFTREKLLDVIISITSTINEQHTKELQTTQNTLQSKINELTFCNEIIQMITSKTTSLESENILLKEQLESKSKEMSDISLNYQDNSKDLNSAMEALENALHAQSTLATMKQESLENLQRVNLLLNDELQLHKNSITSLNQELLEANQTATAAESRIALILQEKEETISKLQKEAEENLQAIHQSTKLRESELAAVNNDVIGRQTIRIAELDQMLKRTQELSDLQLQETRKLLDEQTLLSEQLQCTITTTKNSLSEKSLELSLLTQTWDIERQKILQEKEEAVTSFQTELDRVHQTLSEKSEKCINLQKVIDQLTPIIKSLEGGITTKDEDIFSLRSEISSLNESLNKSNTDIYELQLQLEVRDTTIQQQDTTIQQHLQTITSFTTDNSQLNGRLNLMESLSENNSKCIHELEQNKLEITTKNNQLEKLLEESQKESVTAKQQIVSLQSEISNHITKQQELQQMLEEVQLQLQVTQDEYALATSTYNSHLQSLEDTTNKQSSDLINNNSEISSLKIQLAKLTSSNNEITNENTHLKKTYGNIYQETENTKSEFEDRVRQLQTTIDTLAEALGNRELIINKLQGKLEVANKEVEDKTAYSKEVEYECNQKIEFLLSDLTEKKTIADVFESQMTEYKNQVHFLTNENHELKTTLTVIEEEKAKFFSEMQYIINKAKLTEDSLQTKIIELETEILSLNTIINTKDSQIENLNESLSTLNQQSSSTSSSLQHQLQLALDSITTLQFEITSHISNIEELKLQLAAHIEQLQAYENEQKLLKSNEEELNHQIKIYEESTKCQESKISLLEIEINSKLSIISDYQNEQSKLLESTQYLESQLDTMKTNAIQDNETAKNEYAVLQKILNGNMLEKIALQDELEALKNRLQIEQENNQSHVDTIAEQISALTDKEVTINELDSKSEEISKLYHEQQAYNENLLSQINALNEQEMQLEETISQLNNEKSYLENQIQDLENSAMQKNASMKKTLNEMTEESKTNAMKIQDLEATLLTLREKLEDVEVENLKAEIDEKNEEIKELTNVYLKFRSKALDLESECNSNKTIIHDLQQSEKEKEIQLRDITVQLEKAKGTLKEAKLQYRNTEDEAVDSITQKIRELQDAEAEMDRLRHLNESYKSELLITRQQVKDLELAFQESISKLMMSTSGGGGSPLGS